MPTMNRLTEMFHDTCEKCRTVGVLKDTIGASLKGQRIVRENDEIALRTDPQGEVPEVIVSPKKTFQAASAYAGKHICVLNFADAFRPGGLVEYGATTQEEDLCRCSTLYPCISSDDMYDGFYTPNAESGTCVHRDLIYTPGVVVFRDDITGEMLPEDDWFAADVITCAAPDLTQTDMTDGELSDFHEFMFGRMLDVASASGAEVLILGAFGCGAFCNDPAIVSEAAGKALGAYRGSIGTVEFAVYCGHRDANYSVFEERFSA